MFLDKYDDSNASMMLKIVVMGRVGAGKSAITSRFAHGAYPGQRYKPTTVANFAMKQFRFNNSTINAQVRVVAPLRAVLVVALAHCNLDLLPFLPPAADLGHLGRRSAAPLARAVLRRHRRCDARLRSDGPPVV